MIRATLDSDPVPDRRHLPEATAYPAVAPTPDPSENNDMEHETEAGESTQIDDKDLYAAKPTVDDGAFGSMYPIITWINGMPGKKAVGGLAFEGGFFIDAEQGIEVPGAVPYTHVTSSGAEIEGAMVRDLTFTPIQVRRCFRVDTSQTGEQSFMQQYAVNEWDEAAAKGKPRGVTHLLSVCKGMKDPVVIVFTGQSSVAVSAGGAKAGILSEYANKIVMRARALARKAGHSIDYPRCAFRLTIGPDGDRSKKGKFTPTHTEVGKKEKSQITLPVWVDKPDGAAPEDQIRSLFVGNTTLGHFEDLFRDGQNWFDAWTQEVLMKRRGETPLPASTPSNGAPASGLPADSDIPF